MLRLRFAEFILSEAERLSMTGGNALGCHAERSEASHTAVVYLGAANISPISTETKHN